MSRANLKSTDIKNWVIISFYIIIITMLLFSGTYLDKLTGTMDQTLGTMKEISQCEVRIEEIYYKGMCNADIQQAVVINMGGSITTTPTTTTTREVQKQLEVLI